MRRTLSLLGAIAGLFLTLLVGAPAQATGYTPTTPTSCSVTVKTITVGAKAPLRVVVSRNDNGSATGSARLSITKSSSTKVLWTKTIAYAGSATTVTGPVLPAGRYNVKLAFTPDNSAVGGCSSTSPFLVSATGGESTGALPDTGGPNVLFLLLGVGLVAGGTGLVAKRTRRTA